MNKLKIFVMSMFLLVCIFLPFHAYTKPEKERFSWKWHEGDFNESEFSYASEYYEHGERVTLTFSDGCIATYFMIDFIRPCCFEWINYRGHDSIIM